MKKVFYFLIALFLASCAEQELYEDIADAPKGNIEIDNQYAYLLEQARWETDRLILSWLTSITKVRVFNRISSEQYQCWLWLISMEQLVILKIT